MDKDILNFNLSDDFLESEFESKILNDYELSGDDTIDLDQLVLDAKEMRRILHIRENNKRRIIDEFEKNIVVDIPEGSEDTLIRDLENFNNNMYGSDDSIFFHLSHNEVEEITNDELVEEEPEMIEVNFEDERNISPIEVAQPMPIEKEYEDEFEQIQNAKTNSRHFNDLFDDDKITEILESEDKKILVDNENDKEKIINYVVNEIDEGKFGLIKIKRPLYISGKRIHKKIKSIRKKFIDTYGSEIFSKVSDWIIEEQNLYQNLERIERINKYKENKLKLSKQMQIKERLKRFFR